MTSCQNGPITRWTLLAQDTGVEGCASCLMAVRSTFGSEVALNVALRAAKATIKFFPRYALYISLPPSLFSLSFLSLSLSISLSLFVPLFLSLFLAVFLSPYVSSSSLSLCVMLVSACVCG